VCISQFILFFSEQIVSMMNLQVEILEEQDYMTETLQKMEENRDENKKLLKQKKSSIIKQISAAKSKVHDCYLFS
jgi:uncharacterized membrane protein YcaP (DUF421 family)